MGQFSNDQVIGDVLGGILQGAVQGAVLGQVLQRGYSERGRRADSGFGGGSGFNFPGGGGMGGGRIAAAGLAAAALAAAGLGPAAGFRACETLSLQQKPIGAEGDHLRDWGDRL